MHTFGTVKVMTNTKVAAQQRNVELDELFDDDEESWTKKKVRGCKTKHHNIWF